MNITGIVWLKKLGQKIQFSDWQWQISDGRHGCSEFNFVFVPKLLPMRHFQPRILLFLKENFPTNNNLEGAFAPLPCGATGEYTPILLAVINHSKTSKIC